LGFYGRIFNVNNLMMFSDVAALSDNDYIMMFYNVAAID
jgi:hypothetical protein